MSDEEIIEKLNKIVKEKETMYWFDEIKSALDLINRQRVEIERLSKAIETTSNNADTAFQDGLNGAQDLYAEQIKDEIKSAAVKEFAERLKNKIKTECNPYGKPTFDYDTSIAIMRYIDNLLKEMVGE